MPTPEELGVAAVKRPENENIDWAAVHDRLNHLGATCFHLERMSQSACRITCLLPTDQPDRSHRIEAVASSEAEAIRLILAKAQEWAAGR